MGEYHVWTSGDIRKVQDYIDRTDKPLSLYRLSEFAKTMCRSRDSLRGAVGREMKKRHDLRG